MSKSDGLTIVTLVVASISMLLSCLALWPQWRHALAFLRDIILWAALLFLVVGAATLGWRYHRLSNRPPAVPAEPWEQSAVMPSSDSMSWHRPGR